MVGFHLGRLKQNAALPILCMVLVVIVNGSAWMVLVCGGRSLTSGRDNFLQDLVLDVDRRVYLNVGFTRC